MAKCDVCGNPMLKKHELMGVRTYTYDKKSYDGLGILRHWKCSGSGCNKHYYRIEVPVRIV